MDEAAFLDFTVGVIRRIEGKPGYVGLPRRRVVVQRTFAWMTRWRPLVLGYEVRIDISEAMTHFAMGGILLRKISH